MRFLIKILIFSTISIVLIAYTMVLYKVLKEENLRVFRVSNLTRFEVKNSTNYTVSQLENNNRVKNVLKTILEVPDGLMKQVLDTFSKKNKTA